MASANTQRPVPAFWVLKVPKDHGTQKLIEGNFPEQEGARVVVVDDVVTKGSSALGVINAIRENTTAQIACVIFIVDREEGGADMLREQGYNVRSLFTRRDLRNK